MYQKMPTHRKVMKITNHGDNQMTDWLKVAKCDTRGGKWKQVDTMTQSFRKYAKIGQIMESGR